jgi:arylsulfatase A-like enzyme
VTRRGAARVALGWAALLACACGSDDPAGGYVGLPPVATMALVPMPVSMVGTEAGTTEAGTTEAGTTEAGTTEAPSAAKMTEAAIAADATAANGAEAATTNAAAGVSAIESGAAKASTDPAPPAKPSDGAAAPLRPAFDLADNRLLAHWIRDGGLHVVAGSPGFARYVQNDRRRPSWRLGERRDDVPVAVLRRAGILTLPLDPATAGHPGTIALRLYSRGRAQLSLALNGAAPIDVLLVRGWQTVSAPVSARSWRAGENGLRLSLRGASEISVAWLRIGGKLADEAERGESEADPDRLLSFFDPADHTLRLGAREQLIYFLYLPEYAVLSGKVIGEGPDAADCRVAVQVRAHSAELDAELGPGRERIDLDSLAGQIARVRFELRGCKAARLEGGALMVPGAANPPPSGPPPRYVILWIMDTLRADRIRPIRPGARPVVPALERLAAEGAVFRQAYVQGNESQTSHASMWTSLFPGRHGVRTAGNGGTWKLSDDFATMGETARRAGFYTSGVTANGMITKSGGYSRGFDSYINMMREGNPRRTNGWIPGEKILDRALGTLQGRERQPFFLFVGTIDTHKPWVGHEPWLSQYDPDDYSGRFEFAAYAGDLGIKRGSMRCTRTPSERDLVRINAIYDSAVSYQDSVLGRMLEQLDRWGIADQTMIIVTADHGEELWEDGRCGHGASLRDTLVHVPLFVRYPPLIPPGTVIDEGVDVLDVLPTLSDALGLDPPKPSQGQSLLPLAHGLGRGYPRPSYASQYEYAHAMRVGWWKIWQTRTGGLELFDLATDPAERATVSNRPIEARYMIDVLRLFLANRVAWRKRDWGVVNNMTAAAPEALARAGDGDRARKRR